MGHHVGVIISNGFREKRGRAMGISFTGEGFGALVLAPVAGLLLVRWPGVAGAAGRASQS